MKIWYEKIQILNLDPYGPIRIQTNPIRGGMHETPFIIRVKLIERPDLNSKFEAP